VCAMQPTLTLGSQRTPASRVISRSRGNATRALCWLVLLLSGCAESHGSRDASVRGGSSPPSQMDAATAVVMVAKDASSSGSKPQPQPPGAGFLGTGGSGLPGQLFGGAPDAGCVPPDGSPAMCICESTGFSAETFSFAREEIEQRIAALRDAGQDDADAAVFDAGAAFVCPTVEQADGVLFRIQDRPSCRRQPNVEYDASGHIIACDYFLIPFRYVL
jgi:hypothetical protein